MSILTIYKLIKMYRTSLINIGVWDIYLFTMLFVIKGEKNVKLNAKKYIKY